MDNGDYICNLVYKTFKQQKLMPLNSDVKLIQTLFKQIIIHPINHSQVLIIMIIIALQVTVQ